ncbi:probable D-lactate dehydrogenase, mitochondrial isoform X2 [Dysidea avara]
MPTNVDHVSTVVRLCNKEHIPVIPFGTGTGLEGGVGATHGGVCIDLSGLNEVVEVHSEDFYCTVRPGVTRKALNSFIRDTGLWFPIDPGADASLCGMAATSASGTNAVRYGTMRENVLNLQVVLPNGDVLYTGGKGGRAKKSSAGYNLTNLFVGSEGTLGIITEATLRLYGIPEETVSAVCPFPTAQAAVDTTVEILQGGIPMAKIEFLDDLSVKASNRHFNLGLDEMPTLFMELHGSALGVQEQVEMVSEIAQSNGALKFEWESDHEKRAKLWRARHEWWYSGLAMEPGKKGFATDVCVPISKLPQVLLETKQDLESSPFVAPIIGHVGDGNFHSLILLEPDNDEELAAAKELAFRMAKRAMAVGGTCTGEHGIGRGKMKLLEKEAGAAGIATMKNIKLALDPNGIMNPGKIITI